ncbi:MAG: peptidase E [Christensenellaceae bacterium]|jgi:dipeptidase E|nr:peptidase E [Christensenellaceae bacterium]
MVLYLSSYKLGNRTDELKHYAQTHKKILLIANSRDHFTDLERIEKGVSVDEKQLSELGFEVTRLDLRKFFGKQKDLEKFIAKYNGFYVIGGNTFVLRKAFALSGMDNILLSFWSYPNYLYIGYSAGICVLCEDLHGLILVDEPGGDPIWNGLGYIHPIYLPHYRSDHPESKMVNDCVKYCKAHDLPYETLKDGDVKILNSHTWKRGS